jgi:hypothetical protein
MTPIERSRYDARVEQVIKEIESGRRAVPEAGRSEPFPIDEATVRELEDLYHRKRQRASERNRAGRDPARP